MWVAFANAKATHIFFSKNISAYAMFNDQSFNNLLTKDIVCFEQLGPGGLHHFQQHVKWNWFVQWSTSWNLLFVGMKLPVLSG